MVKPELVLSMFLLLYQSFIHLVIHSFHKYLLSAYDVLSSVKGTGLTIVNKHKMILTVVDLTVW